VDDDELVPLPVAARMLDTRPENLRKRLQRGLTLRGVKRAGAWHVRRADVEREIRATAPPGTLGVQNSVVAGLERELVLTWELLDAERRRADRLDVLLAEERQASAELRRLLAHALGQPDAQEP
jgi:hypothetical protein